MFFFSFCFYFFNIWSLLLADDVDVNDHKIVHFDWKMEMNVNCFFFLNFFFVVVALFISLHTVFWEQRVNLFHSVLPSCNETLSHFYTHYLISCFKFNLFQNFEIHFCALSLLGCRKLHPWSLIRFVTPPCVYMRAYEWTSSLQTTL